MKSYNSVPWFLLINIFVTQLSIAQSAENYFETGMKKYEMKEYQGAILDFTKAIKLKPKYLQSYYQRGHTKFLLGDKLGAITDYTEAIKLIPMDTCANDSKFRMIHGVIHEFIEDATENKTKVIVWNPKYFAMVYSSRGNVKCDLGDNHGAIADYTKAIKWNPEDARLYVNLGLIKYTLGDNSEAIENYNKAIKLNPNLIQAYFNLGNAKLQLGQNSEAILYFNQAIELNPKYAEVYSNRGLAKFFSGDKLGACQDWEIAAHLGVAEAKELIKEYCK